MVSHTGTETLPRLLREAAVEDHFAMRGSVTMRRCVEDEGLRVVNFCHLGKTVWGRIPLVDDGTG